MFPDCLFTWKICFFPPVFPLIYHLFVGAQIDVHITPGTHASEEAGEQADLTLLLK